MMLWQRIVSLVIQVNECLTTPQHEKQIVYWVSEQGKCNGMVIKLKSIKKHSVKSCAINKSITV